MVVEVKEEVDCGRLRLRSPQYIIPAMHQCEVTDNGTRCTADGKLYKTHTFCKGHKEDYRGYIRMYQWAAEDLQKTSGAIAVFTARLPTFDTPEHLSAPADFLLYYLIAFDREIHWRRKHNDTFFAGGASPPFSPLDRVRGPVRRARVDSPLCR